MSSEQLLALAPFVLTVGLAVVVLVADLFWPRRDTLIMALGIGGTAVVLVVTLVIGPNPWTLGALGAVAAGVVPLGFGLDAIRQVLLGAEARGLLPVATEAWILAGLTVVFLVLAHFSLAHLERLSKQEGRLTTRWQ